MNREELAARRERYFDLVASGMNFTAAARAVGVSKRIGKVWRNGRTRATGRNEAPSVDWYRGDMPQPAPPHARYLSEAERIQIADLPGGRRILAVEGGGIAFEFCSPCAYP